jgi:hypothetical protein
LLLGILVVGVAVLMLRFLLVMAGVRAAILFWLVAFAAVLGTWIFWLVFPGDDGLAVLMLALLIGLFLSIDNPGAEPFDAVAGLSSPAQS